MTDNLLLSRQFMLDLYSAKCQQLRGLQAEVAQLKRLLDLPDQRPARNGAVPLIEGTPVESGRDGSEWS